MPMLIQHSPIAPAKNDVSLKIQRRLQTAIRYSFCKEVFPLDFWPENTRWHRFTYVNGQDRTNKRHPISRLHLKELKPDWRTLAWPLWWDCVNSARHIECNGNFFTERIRATLWHLTKFNSPQCVCNVNIKYFIWSQKIILFILISRAIKEIKKKKNKHT
jgi:hypothetical protein